MANTVLKSNQVFPVGTSVTVYNQRDVQARSHRHGDGPPAPLSGTETQTVQADGTLTFTTLTAGVAYAAYALIGGEKRWVLVHGS